MHLTEDRILYAVPAEPFHSDGVVVLVDREGPDWVATDARGTAILSRFDGRAPFGEVVRAYAAEHRVDFAKAWQHVETLSRDALRRGWIAVTPRAERPYAGRAPHLVAEPLHELWIHTNNPCNLSCLHCLDTSRPAGDRGLPPPPFLEAIGQARALGARRFFFTGGEPFVRDDLLDLVDAALADPAAQVAILTNGMLLPGRRIAETARRDLSRLRLQISLDGSTPLVNDPIRGAGSFVKTVEGIRAAVASGVPVTVTTVIAEANADDVSAVTRLAASLGVRNHHLLWLHKRGRAGEGGLDHTPAVSKVIEVVRRAQEAARECGVTIDNVESVKARLRSPAGTRRDLAGAGISTLCVYSDGKVYPSAALAGEADLCMGSILERPLEAIRSESPVARLLREATVEKKGICRGCPLKFLCGGGDLEHAYAQDGDVMAHDPYCDLHKAMFDDAMVSIATERRPLASNAASGFNAPVLFTGMGEGAVHCALGEPEPEVVTTRSECVLSFDLDAPRAAVRGFYGEAAEKPQEALCCPVKPSAEDLAHIPREVVERFYGCGSPVADALIRPGETSLDLGSGAGIDVFISARRVGPSGRAIGVDMTDGMLKVARECQAAVARNLGYDAVEFRKGFLEEVPVADASVDVVTSNCVVNLSPDKPRVFAEAWRVLKDHGRLVLADIVSEREVPPHQRRDPRLWGECISGALTEEELSASLERAGFYGLQVLKKTFWKEVEGCRFFSVTVRGWKFRKTAGCVFIGQSAIYQGPYKGVSDEEGHWFPRDVAVEVCTDTASKLSAPPYAGQFVVTDPTRAVQEDYRCCTPDGDGTCC